MHANLPKGPAAPSERDSSVEGQAAAPRETAGASNPVAGLSAAFKAALGAKPQAPHVRLTKPHAFDPVAQAKAGTGGRAPRPAPVRSSMIGPRSGHK